MQTIFVVFPPEYDTWDVVDQLRFWRWKIDGNRFGVTMTEAIEEIELARTERTARETM